MVDDSERQEDPVLIALNTIIGEIREIRAELDSVAKRVAWVVGGDDKASGSSADNGSAGA